MSPLARAVRLVLWLVAAGLIVIGAMNLGLEYVRHRARFAEVSVIVCVVWSVVAGLGLLLAFGAPGLARRLTGEDEDEE